MSAASQIVVPTEIFLKYLSMETCKSVIATAHEMMFAETNMRAKKSSKEQKLALTFINWKSIHETGSDKDVRGSQKRRKAIGRIA